MTLLDANVQQDPVLGEDTWELFEAIESSFAVDLGDYREMCGKTVKELAELINKKADYPAGDKCLSSVAFYRVRRAFETLYSIPRKAIRPATPVSDLLPLEHRSTKWPMLEEHLGLTVPELNYPNWILWLSLLAPPALLISLRTFLKVPLNWSWIFTGSIALYMVTFATIIPALNARFPIRRSLPKNCETFSGLVTVVLLRNYAAFASQSGSSGESGVLKALQQLTAMQLGMEPEEIAPEKRIPQDLNIY